MKEFKIPVSYEVYGYVYVKGTSLEDAYNNAIEQIDELPLPDYPEYIDGSYKIDSLEEAHELNL